MTRLSLIALLMTLLTACAGGPPDRAPLITSRILLAGHVLVPATCNGHEGYFILDNGSPRCLVHSKYLGADWAVPDNPWDAVPGATVPLTLAARTLPLVPITNPQIDALVDTWSRGYGGTPIFGLLGHEFLKDYIVELDCPRRTLCLFAPDTESATPTPGPHTHTAPFDVGRNGHVYLSDGELDGVTGDLHLDLGSPGFNIDSDLLTTFKSNGTSPTQLSWGPMAWTLARGGARNVRGVHKRPTLLGEIGLDQVMTSVLTLDYGRRRVTLHRHADLTPSRLALGIKLTPGDALEVADVADRGVLKDLGVHPGDRILEFNGRPVRDPLELRDASYPTPRDAREPHVTVERDGTVLKL